MFYLLRSIRCVLFTCLFVFPALMAPSASAQGDGEGFPLGAATAYCEPGYLGVFDGCTPWEGVTVTFISVDGGFTNSCVTSGTDRAAGCGVDVSFGSTITASIDPAVIPAGYELEGAVAQQFTIPEGPPEGEYGGPVFVLLPASDATTDSVPDDEVSATDTDTVTSESPLVTSLPTTGSGMDVNAGNSAFPSLMLLGTAVLIAGAVGVRRIEASIRR